MMWIRTTARRDPCWPNPMALPMGMNVGAPPTTPGCTDPGRDYPSTSKVYYVRSKPAAGNPP